MVVNQIYVFGAGPRLVRPCYFQGSTVVCKRLAVDFGNVAVSGDVLVIRLPYQLHQGNRLPQRLRQRYVFSFGGAEGDLRLQFRSPDDGTSSKIHDVPGAGLCCAGVLRRRGLISATTEVRVRVNFDGLVPFGIVDDAVILGGQQVFA
jgi:hypothetical protein